MIRATLLLTSLLATPSATIAQNRDPMPGLVKAPPRLIEFETNEGTWISVDVSKDGRTLVFDLLGDLYALPASGGDATPLVTGTDFASQPRFSPDGGSIAFISDRSGSDNVWITDAAGQNPRAITKESGPIMTSPAWSHDGRHIFVTLMGKTTPRTAELWEFEISTGASKRVVENTNGAPSGLVSEPPPGPVGAHASGDGRFVYFASVTPRAYGVRQGSTSRLMRLDRASGRAEPIAIETPGVAVAVIRRGETLLAKGYGFANLEQQIKVTPETMFESGSLGKQFTAAGIMALVEDERLKLDDSVRTWLPDAPETWQPITLRRLLSHTSGIPDYTGDQMDYRKDHTEADLLKLAYGLTLEFKPGARWNYSNTGYVVLGCIMSKVTGSPYWEFLRKRIFDPAGMPTIRIISEAEVVPHRASGYLPTETGFRHQDWVAPKLNTTADGSMLMSLNDMIAWNEAVRNRRILKPESWALMQSAVTLNSGKSYPYGFAWFIDSAGGQVVHQHSGSWQGFRTQFTRYEGDDLAVVVLANSGASDPIAIGNDVAAIMNPSLAAPPLPSTPLSDADPAITAKVQAILGKAARGEIALEDFSFIRQTIVPRMRTALAQRMKGVNPPADRLDLLQRTDVGDDRRLVYRAFFGTRKFLVTVGITPDGGLMELQIREEPPAP